MKMKPGTAGLIWGSLAGNHGTGCVHSRGGSITGVAQETTVQARAGGGSANWAARSKAAVTQGTGNGAHRLGSGSVRARAWRSWELQAAAMTARAGWTGLGY